MVWKIQCKLMDIVTYWRKLYINKVRLFKCCNLCLHCYYDRDESKNDEFNILSPIVISRILRILDSCKNHMHVIVSIRCQLDITRAAWEESQ